MKTTLSISYFALVIAALCWPAASTWAEGGGSRAGILYGYSVPDQDNVNPHRIFGAKGSASLVPGIFNIGGYYLQTTAQEGTGAERFDYSIHGLEGVFLLGSGNTYLGVRVGMTKIHTDVDDVKIIYSPYHYGLVGGYDYSLFSWLSLGFEGSYMFVRSSDTTKDNIRYEQEKFGILNFLVSLQLNL